MTRDVRGEHELDGLGAALDELGETLEGFVRRDESYRHLYAADASIYSQTPVGVAFPRSRVDIEAILAFARRWRLPVIPRAAGTSLAGQVVGSGLVMDVGRFMTEILRFDPDARAVVVQPGVIQDDLNRFLLPHGFLFGPDTSTGNRAMIGGMIGNNSCGSHSIVYGTTREHVNGVSALLADGTPLELGPMSAEEIEAAIGAGERLGEILEGLRAIVEGVRDEIDRVFPPRGAIRGNTGYALDYLARTVLVDPQGEPLNLARFLCGSEGTLAVVTEAALDVDPLPKAKGVVAAHFATLPAAYRAAVEAVALDPSAVELLDKAILDLTKDQLEHRHNRFFLQGDPAAVVFVEFFRDTPEAVGKAKQQLVERLSREDLAYACVDIAPADAPRVWALRKAGLGLLMGIPGDEKAVAFVEDTTVPVGRLPEYAERFAEIMASHETSSVFYGHASVGELHLRPVLNLKRADGVRKMERIAEQVADLVMEFGGSLSGEHGDGRVRSPYIERVMGPKMADAFRQTKRLWDPDGLLNPGKIVDPEPISADLRTRLDRSTPEVRTVMRFDVDDGLMRHVERCNGAGVCRRSPDAGGTMCPSYMATREELHTTRGRANLFRELLLSRNPAEAMAADELYEALSLCLMCKGCKAECPASVDMAKLKSEFLQHYWDVRGTPLGVRAIGHIARLNRLGIRFPRLTNAVLGSRLGGKLIRRLVGIDPEVPLPEVSRISLKRWFARRVAPPSESPIGTVALLPDEFTSLQDVEVGIAAVELFEGLGYRVLLPDVRETGRALVSKGLLRAARDRARHNVEQLQPLAADGIPIIGLEPSAALTLADEYPDLVPKESLPASREVAHAVVLAEDFLAREAERQDLRAHFDETPRRIWVHGHCHQKALVGAGGTIAALQIPTGHRVDLIDAGCCGMAGSFGYEHRELSVEIAELKLFPALRQVDDGDLVAAPGFSCRHQIATGLGMTALHPVQILNSALK